MKIKGLLFFIVVACFAQTTFAQGTAFTYQGRLDSDGNPASGSYDLTFSTFSVSSGAGQVGGSITNSPIVVSNGLFTVLLDFGAGVFTGPDRWLEISVRTNGGGAFTTLTPRQKLTPAPYAITATAAASATTAASVSAGAVAAAGLQTSAVDSSKILDGTITSSDLNSGLLNSTFWRLLGNGGTTAGVNFLGTTDNQPLELKVNGQRAFRFEPTAGSPNLIGGFSGNSVINAVGVTISGGSANSVSLADYGTIAGGGTNVLGNNGIGGQAHFSAIGGGAGNLVRGAIYATVAGGRTNTILGTDLPGFYYGDYGTIGGGTGNRINQAGLATIGGGEGNSISQGNPWGTIGGGRSNSVSAQAGTIAGGQNNVLFGDGGAIHSWPNLGSTIGGGVGNSIDIESDKSTIAGGDGNSVYLDGFGTFSRYAAIGGGQSNVVAASYGTVSGGANNLATNQYATVGGGSNNISSGLSALVAGGAANSATSDYSTVGGGSGNTTAGASFGTIAGGSDNVLGQDANGGYSPYSTIGGGQSNYVSAVGVTIAGGVANRVGSGYALPSDYAVISGGLGNNLAGGHERSATIGGGESNRVSGSGGYATIGGGKDNNIMGDSWGGWGCFYATIGGGGNNWCLRGDYATIAGGYGNKVEMPFQGSRRGATVGGGMENTVTLGYGTIPGGVQAVTRSYGQMAYASGQFATNGDAQTSVYVCRGTTADNNLTEIFLDGVSERMRIPTNSTWCFDIIVTGRASNGTSAAYHILGEAKNNSGTVTLGSAVTKTVLSEDVASWDATATVDSPNGALVVKVTGQNSLSVRWAASVRTVEVTY